MRVLLTGHLGYIGTILAPMLMAAGHDLVGLDSDLYAACTFGNGIIQIPNIKKDIRDLKANDLDGFEAVLH
jgi:nucleoside-diphosphate-sugar epimerase